MMQPQTRLRIYRAANDWVYGLTIREIAAIHDRSEWTIYQWKLTDAWAEAVAGRERQKRKSLVRSMRFTPSKPPRNGSSHSVNRRRISLRRRSGSRKRNSIIGWNCRSGSRRCSMLSMMLNRKKYGKRRDAKSVGSFLFIS